MSREMILPGALRRDFKRNVVLPVFAVLLVVMSGAVLTLSRVAAIANQVSQEKQQQIIHNLLQRDIDNWRSHHLSLLAWQPLHQHLSDSAADRQWRDQQLGEALWHMQGSDEVWLLDARNQPLAGWRQGKPVAPQAWTQQASAFLPWLNHYDRHHPPVLADLLRLHQQVAEMSMSALRAPDGSGDYKLVRIRFMADSFFRALEIRGVLHDFHFSMGHDAPEDSVGFLLKSAIGVPVSYISWSPMRPGSQIQHVMLPFVAVVLVIIALLCLLMMHRLARASHSLADSLHQLQESEGRAQHLASHDILSGLPNRVMINTRLSELLAALPPHRRSVALLLLDLDRFKMINDTWGHPIGDALIIAVARRLTQLLPEGAIAGRLGGDEFVVLLNQVRQRGDVERLCQQVIDELARPLLIQNNQLHTGVSIGVVLAPEHGLNRRELMRKADVALYAAKSRGRGQYCLFENGMDSAIKHRQLLADELREALESHQGLMLWFQPILCARSGKIAGLEALMRWQHPQRGMISPAEFIPIAEETGLIVPLGEWTLAQAFAMAKRWPRLTIAVNVSPLQLRAAGFTDRLMALVAEAGITPRQIELEITEGVLIDDEQDASQLIRTLRELGFQLALDDFGTGYSSLSYLSRFQVDTIKIDRAFTRQLGQALNAAAIVRAVVDLGHALQLSVTAEGVETAQQHQALVAAGCDRLQGFLFSKPLPPEAIHALLAAEAITSRA